MLNKIIAITILLAYSLCADSDVIRNFSSTSEENFFQQKYGTWTAGVSVEAIKNTSIAKVEIEGRKGNQHLSMGYSGPVDKDTEKGTFADLDGLKGGNVVNLKYVYTSIYSMMDGPMGQEEKECYQKLDEWEILYTHYKNIKTTENNTSKAYKKADAWINKNGKRGSGEALCVKNGNPIRIGKNFKVTEIIYTLEGKYGKNKYDWFDSTTLATDKGTKEDFSVAAEVKYIDPSYWSFGLGYRLEQVYEEQKTSKQICSPVSGFPGYTECSNNQLGAPEKNKSSIFYAYGNAYFGANDDYAVSVKVSQNVNNGVTAIDMPVYFLSGKNRSLKAGITFGYRSDEDEVIGLFISKPFRISHPTSYKGGWC